LFSKSRIATVIRSEQETGLPSFGEKLKLEREKRKITLDQISASTKIGTRMLQALEGDKFSQLPGGIFNKGFVRAYARVVGLDEDQTVADYLQASGEAAPPGPEMAARETSVRETEQRISRLEAISDTPSRPLPWGLFAVILLAVALVLSLLSHRRREQERLAARPAAVSSQTNAASPTGESGSALQPSPVSAPMNAAATPTSVPGDKSLVAPGQTSPASSEATLSAAGEFTVLIQAREESWVSVTVDGKPTPSELLEPGNQRTIRAHNKVVVKTGNSGAVDFRLDGRKLEVGGEYGEVKTVTIGRAGVLSSTSPAPTTP
jgi:cytoskeleton protein RodZ